MNVRQCDICNVVKPQQGPWIFVTDGKKEPNEWVGTQHWCLDCMKTVKDLIRERLG